MDISAQLKLLPKLPGVYLMHDQNGEIIYIGKAKNLKNRVTSYFKKHHDLPKLRVMVPKIIRFEFNRDRFRSRGFDFGIAPYQKTQTLL